MASAQAAARSLARSGKAAMRSDCDIDFAAAFDHGEFLQPMPLVDDVGTVFEMELPAVPGADDVHVALIENLAEMNAFLADLLHHLRHLQSFAGRATLVRADIAVGVVFAFVEDHADFGLTAFDQPGVSLGDLAFLANTDFRHASSH